jgi:hypothetical protein
MTTQTKTEKCDAAVEIIYEAISRIMEQDGRGASKINCLELIGQIQILKDEALE